MAKPTQTHSVKNRPKVKVEQKLTKTNKNPRRLRFKPRREFTPFVSIPTNMHNIMYACFPYTHVCLLTIAVNMHTHTYTRTQKHTLLSLSRSLLFWTQLNSGVPSRNAISSTLYSFLDIISFRPTYTYILMSISALLVGKFFLLLVLLLRLLKLFLSSLFLPVLLSPYRSS